MIRIIPGLTRFLCAKDTMIVVKSSTTVGKWYAVKEIDFDNENLAGMMPLFSETYIHKYRINDKKLTHIV